MPEFEALRASVAKPRERLSVPVHTPQYVYLVCDLLTDQLLANIPLTGVSFSRRVSRIGDFSGTWKIPDRNQAILADAISKGSGRYAIWVLRDNVVWWGGIIWNCQGKIGARSYDSVSIQAATFESYLDHRYIEQDWVTSASHDIVVGPLLAWQSVQSYANSNIGVQTPFPTYLAGDTVQPGLILLQSDQKTFADVVKVYTDTAPGCQTTIDVTRAASGARVKTLRVASDFSAIEVTNMATLSGYRIPSWEFTRDATKSGTVFRVWGNPQEGNVGEETFPRPSNLAKRQDLLDAGWPRLDVSADVGEIPRTGYQPVLDSLASALMGRYGGIRDVLSYEVDLSTSQWHPNQIGQHVVIKRSQKDWWRPGETSVVTPVVVEFAAPERGQSERVTFTIDGGEEG